MKKTIILYLLIILLIPGFVSAKEQYIYDLDLNISMSDDWIIFTRDNLEDNPDLDIFDLAPDEAFDILESDNLYMDSYKYSNYDNYDYSFFIRALESDMNNLKNYDENDVDEFANNVIENTNAKDFKVFTSNNMTIIETNYKDQGYYLREYYTVVNGNAITFTAQSEYSFNEEQKKEILEMIKSVDIEIDPDFADEPSPSFLTLIISIFILMGFGSLIIGIFVMIIYTIIIIARKNKRQA